MAILADISGYQDSHGAIDFQRLRGGGISGVIIKATEGASGVSPYYVRDATAADAAGLAVGAYCFTRPDLGDPITQADTFARLANQATRLDWWADDAEVGGNAGAASWSDWHGQFCEHVDAVLGARVAPESSFLYSAAWCERFGWGFDARVTKRRLWVAQYGGPAPAPLPGWNQVSLWQDSSNATYPGIVGSVDEDVTLVPFPPFNATTGVKMGSPHLQDVVASATTPDGTGTYDVEANGGLWPLGNAPTFAAAGSGPDGPRNMVGHLAPGRHIVDFAVYSSDGRTVTGYWFLQDDGGIWPFGAAPGWGSAGGKLPGTAVRLVFTPTRAGYVIKERDGGAWPFGPDPPVFASEA